MVGRKSVGFFSQTGIQFLFSLSRMSFRFGPIFLHVLHQAVRLEIQLLDAPVNLAVRDFQRDGFSFSWLASSLLAAASACFIRSAACLRLSFFCCSSCLICWADVVQVLRLFVVALIAMAAHAALLPEQIFAFADRPSHIAADQHHVGGMAGLAAGFDVLLGKQRPQPMLIVSVRLLHAGRGAAVALVAGRAAELVGIVHLQHSGSGWLTKARAYSSGFFSPLAVMDAGVIFSGSRMPMWQDSQRSTMLASATLICTIFGIPLFGLLFQAVDLLGREVDHVFVDVGGHLGAGRGHRLQHFTEFGVQLGAFVFELVVLLFELGKLYFSLCRREIQPSRASSCIRRVLRLLSLPEALVSVSIS